LVHSIAAAAAHHLIVAASRLPAIAEVAKNLPTSMQYWLHGETERANYPRIDQIIETYSGSPPWITPTQQPGAADTALLIYTSGTTGLPKAAKVPHGRLVEWSYWFAGMLDIQPDDRLYNCLPMYHSTGGVVAIGSALVRGASVLIRERFSARRFWDDVIDNECSLFIYIGELCRYLVHSAPHPREAEHRLRLCYGNGLQGDVWQRFQARFGIPKILEFYAATEGNVSLYNCEGKPGAIGHVPAMLAHRFPVALIKCDMATGEILRDAAGLCLRAAPGEPGEAIGKIASMPHLPARRFDGYTDSSASARKILRNVFHEGDAWFRTGDLMRQDALGYYYFVDRLGDTFRWKGENISSTEVAATLTACAGVTGAVVFGAAVPGQEGRAGMAALTIDDAFSWAALRDHLAATLPAYARPVFIRICGTLDITGTFKLTKTRLAAEGFAAVENADRIWFFDRAADMFVPCDEPRIKSLLAGKDLHI
jgi:fatty-acyl-CoA synthase